MRAHTERIVELTLDKHKMDTTIIDIEMFKIEYPDVTDAAIAKIQKHNEKVLERIEKHKTHTDM